MCADQGNWKLSWGKVGEDRYIADIDYDNARCLALLPPTTADTDSGGAAEAEGPQLPSWQHPGDADLASAEPSGPRWLTGCPDGSRACEPPSPCPTKEKPCLFNVRTKLARPFSYVRHADSRTAAPCYRR